MSKTVIILFGATGDLSREKLFPALASLYDRNKLPEDLTILSLGRRDYTEQDFVDHISTKRQYSPEFLRHVEYFKMDLSIAIEYDRLAEHIRDYGNRLFYVAVAPDMYKTILQGISLSQAYQEQEGGWSRVAIEKPFGVDHATARDLNNLVGELFHEENTYRIDHYLGKDTVENILAFRFVNPLFENVWNREYIDHIQITSAETAGVEGRTAFYASVGATRDLMQNHLMQLITLLTIDQPESLTFDGLADAKRNVLRDMRAQPEQSFFGQYEDEEVAQVLGQTETYSMTTFEVANSRWEGVPIYVRTGKKLAERVTEISVYFKLSAQTLFAMAPGTTGSNVVTFRIQPNEGVFVQFVVKSPDKPQEVDTAQLVFCYDTAFRTKLADAYENLYEALLGGMHMIALRGDIIEESWRIIDELLAKRDMIKFARYAPGSWGPEGADAILNDAGRSWEVAEQDICNGVIIK